MNSRTLAEGIQKAARGIGAIGVATVLVGAMTLASVPVAAGAKSGEENRVVNYRAVNRAEIESLQRWVSAGHEDWCKDARLVAAEELKRVAAHFAGDSTELHRVDLREGFESGGNENRVAFEWTPLDGRATYRVMVERFDWLLPIAGRADAVIWVPTQTETELHN